MRSKIMISALALSTMGIVGASARTAHANTNTTPQVFYWASGDEGSTAMWSTNEGYCFLTGVSGAFWAPSDRVWVNMSNGVWLLGGESNSTGTYAEARCVPWSNAPWANASPDRMSVNAWATATGGGFWSDTEFGAQQSFCTIGGIGGNFQGGMDDLVSVEPLSSGGGSAGWWQLQVQSDRAGVRGNYTLGNGNCVNINNLSLPQWGDYVVNANGGYQNIPLITTESSEIICGLSEVSGALQNDGDFVHVTIENNGSGDTWYLESTGNVSAHARCWWF